MAQTMSKRPSLRTVLAGMIRQTSTTAMAASSAESIKRRRQSRYWETTAETGRPTELARLAGVSKATVSQLESGSANPSVETLWAIGDALNVPFAQLVEGPATNTTFIRAGEATVITSEAGSHFTALLSTSPPNARRDIYFVRAEPGFPKITQPHGQGAVEHVILISGIADVGPGDSPQRLQTGDYLSYGANTAHPLRRARAAHGSRFVLGDPLAL